MTGKATCWAVAALFAAWAWPAAGQTGTAATEDAAAGDLIAVQVRNQGYDCAEPVSASRDASVSDDAVWTLTCANARYRVRLIPDQAAAIETLD